MRFSEKYKAEIVTPQIQKYYMDLRLRREIWNILYKWIAFHTEKHGSSISLTSEKDSIFRGIWLYKDLYLDDIILDKQEYSKFLKELILTDRYYRIYDLLEMVNQFELESNKVWIAQTAFPEMVNFVLEKNNSGWKFSLGRIHPIEQVTVPKTLDESKTLRNYSKYSKKFDSDYSKEPSDLTKGTEEDPFAW